MDALTAMVQSLRGAAMPYPREDVVAELAHCAKACAKRARQAKAPISACPASCAKPSRRESRRRRRPTPPPWNRPAPAAEVASGAPEQPAAPMAAPVAQVVAIARAEPAPVVQPIAAGAAAAPAVEAAPRCRRRRPWKAEAAGPFEAGKDQRKIKDDVDRDLLPVFLDEAKEIIPAVSEAVRRWKAAPADHSPAGDLQRHLHTLKGSARMTGLMRLGELAHVLEARINAIDEIESPPRREFEEIEERVDRFSAWPSSGWARGEDILEAEPIQVPVGAVFEQQKDKPAALAVIAAAAQEVAQRDALPPELRESRAALLRVNADMIDRFVNEAGELSIARSRIEGEMAAFKRALTDLTENIARMRSQLREIEIASEGQMQSTIKMKEEIGRDLRPARVRPFLAHAGAHALPRRSRWAT